MNTIRINGGNKKRLATYKGDLSISELNAVIHPAPFDLFVEHGCTNVSQAYILYGYGAYAIRHVKK